MKVFKICFFLFCFASANVFSQTSCLTSAAFCADNASGTTFPAGVNNGSAAAGPDYGCLSTQPNPAWYYFQVSQSGSINIGISGTGGGDVDFICWGPFASASGNCGNLTAGNTVDCSYSGSPTETCTINNAIAGEYYTLLLTNYSNQTQNINFNQVAGTGSTNCNLIAPVTSATICAGETATITTNTNLQSPTFSWSPGGFTTQTITVSPTSTTVYTVTVNGLNPSNTPTTVTNTGTVTVNALPIVTLPTTVTMCENTSATINSTVSPSGTYNYSWSTGATTSNISVTTSTVVSITATNTSNGCISNVATCSVTALANPTITTYPMYNICGGATAVVTPTVTGGLPSYSYSWTPIGLGTADTAIVSSSGVFTVQVTDQNLCSALTEFTVSTNQPTLSIIASPNSICAANSSTLSPSFLGADSYVWSDNSSNDSLVVSTPGAYSLTIAVNGCTATASTTIIANPTPTVTIPASVSMCAGATTTLTSVSVSPSSTYSYLWSTGATSSTINVTNLDTLITLVVIDTNTGCSSDSSNVCAVIVTPNPTVSVNTVYICSGASGTVTPTITGGMPAYSYVWSSGLGTASVATVSSAGVYTVDVTDQNSCFGSTQFTVSTNQPTLAINVNPTLLCGAGSVTLTPTLLGATSYSWSDGSANDTLIVSTVGVYSLSISVNSCSATATNTVNISPTPTVVIPANIGMCSGASAMVTSTVLPTGAYSYTWSNGSNASSVSISTATILTVQVTDNVSGCVSLVSNSCSVVPASNPTVTLPALPIVFCTGFNATLTPTVTGGAPNYTYAWTPSTLGTSSVATTSNQGIYSVLVTDANLCLGSGTVAAVMSSPSVNLFSPDLIICPNDCSEITAIGTSSFTPYTYNWSNSSSTVDSTLMCSAGTVTVTLTDAVGCIATDIITVVDDIIPVASFTATPPSPVTPTVLIDFTSTSTIATGSITSAVWTFGDGDMALGNNVDHFYSTAGTFPVVLTVTGANGCSSSYTVSYVVDAIIETPNVITPNGDGANEFLKFKNLELLGNNNLTIFNRWGKKIFEQDNYKNDWNGGGHTDGTYFYVLSVPEASPSTYKGYVQLIQ